MGDVDFQNIWDILRSGHPWHSWAPRSPRVLGPPRQSSRVKKHMEQIKTQQENITHRIHVWHMFLHLVDFYSKCRYNHTYPYMMLWVRCCYHTLAIFHGAHLEVVEAKQIGHTGVKAFFELPGHGNFEKTQKEQPPKIPKGFFAACHRQLVLKLYLGQGSKE